MLKDSFSDSKNKKYATQKHWSRPYVGLEYSDDFNCADLVEKVLKEVFKKDISFPKCKSGIREQSQQIILNLKKYTNIKNNYPSDGDLVLMSGKAGTYHVGIYCEIALQEGYILHNMKSFGSTVLHSFRSIYLNGLDIEGIYSWK